MSKAGEKILAGLREMLKATYSNKIMRDFPDYDDLQLEGIEIPEEFDYCGYKNDVCPSFIDERRKLKLFIDYVNPANRENPDFPRFCIEEWSEETGNYEVAVTSDRWEEILFDLNHWGE